MGFVNFGKSDVRVQIGPEYCEIAAQGRFRTGSGDLSRLVGFFAEAVRDSRVQKEEYIRKNGIVVPSQDLQDSPDPE